MIEEDEEVETEAEIDVENIELGEQLENFAQNFVSNTVALQTLVLCDDEFPKNNLEPETLLEAVEHYKNTENSKLLDDTLFYLSFLGGNGIQPDDENLPFYVYAVKYIISNDVQDVDVDGWLEFAVKNNLLNLENGNNDTSNATVAQKQSIIINNITSY